MASRPHMPGMTGLRTLEAFDRLGSMAAAGQALGLTQSAVSRQLKTLEGRLGVALFVREGRNLVLTPAAQDYAAEMRDVLAPYSDDTEVLWVQEEPFNMGAWYYVNAHFPDWLGDRFRIRCVARPISASPATGSKEAHKIEQKKLMDQAFAGLEGDDATGHEGDAPRATPAE